MLVHLRRRYVEAGFAPISEKAAFTGFAQTFKSSGTYKAAGAMGRFVQLKMLGDGMKETPLGNLHTPLQGWTKYRSLPPPNARAFRDQWAELIAEPPESPKGDAAAKPIAPSERPSKHGS